jgi:hypothetical protein
MGQPVRAGHDAKEGMRDCRVGEENSKISSHSLSNWAWATERGHYDWMDLHTLFVSLD